MKFYYNHERKYSITASKSPNVSKNIPLLLKTSGNNLFLKFKKGFTHNMHTHTHIHKIYYCRFLTWWIRNFIQFFIVLSFQLIQLFQAKLFAKKWNYGTFVLEKIFFQVSKFKCFEHRIYTNIKHLKKLTNNKKKSLDVWFFLRVWFLTIIKKIKVFFIRLKLSKNKNTFLFSKQTFST